MVGSRSEEVDPCAGWRTGADDYVVNPIPMRKLMARGGARSCAACGLRPPVGRSAMPTLRLNPELTV